MSCPPAFKLPATRFVSCDWNTLIEPSPDSAMCVESFDVGAAFAVFDSVVVHVEYQGVLPVAASHAAFGVGVNAFGHRLDKPGTRLSGDGTCGSAPLRKLFAT